MLLGDCVLLKRSIKEGSRQKELTITNKWKLFSSHIAFQTL